MAKYSAGPSAASLRRAADIQDKIDSLQRELAALLGSSAPAPAAPVADLDAGEDAPVRRRRRRMSAEARARIGAAAKARWARFRAMKEKGGK